MGGALSTTTDPIDANNSQLPESPPTKSKMILWLEKKGFIPNSSTSSSNSTTASSEINPSNTQAHVSGSEIIKDQTSTEDSNQPKEPTKENEDGDGEEVKGEEEEEEEVKDQTSTEDSNQPKEPTKENEDGEEVKGEEEEGECSFCLFMKGGECKDAFIAWEDCVHEAEDNKEGFVEKCREVSDALTKCLLDHPDYYEPLLRAEKALKEEVMKETDKEKDTKEAESNGAETETEIVVDSRD